MTSSIRRASDTWRGLDERGGSAPGLAFTRDGGVQIQRFRGVGGVERDPARLDDLFHDL